MSTSSSRIILVDTNCFLRLYQSSVRPLMGQDIGGYRLLTLEKLVDEFQNNPTLISSYPAVASGSKHDELTNSAIKLSGINKRKIKDSLKELAPYAKYFLESYCKQQNTEIIRRLSTPDLELLATTIIIKGIIATDEWPLRLVATDLMEDQEEYKIGLFNSLKLLHLIEEDGKVSPEDRRKTVRSWILYKEKLLRNWREDYQRLFGEPADSLDDV